ncbi:MAG: hypothetical protein Q8N47_14090 [Bryobacterales bacterium]|nr:hypothetical protein [Bryobacterales bacterium]
MTALGLTRAAILAVILAGALTAASVAAGAWDCTAITPDGEGLKFTLKIQEEGGRIAGTLESARGSTKIVDPKLEDWKLIFKTDYDGATYTLELKISGDTLEGTYKGETASGQVKGARKS